MSTREKNDRTRGSARPLRGSTVAMAPLGAASPARTNVTWDEAMAAYLLSADEVVYRVNVGDPEEYTGLLSVEGRIGDGPWLPLVRGAGMLFREAEGGVLPPEATHQRCELQALSHNLRGRAVALKYEEQTERATLRRTVQLRLRGVSLEIQVSSPGGKQGETYCGFSLGHLGPEGARKIQVPGLPDPLLQVGGGEAGPLAYFSAYADRYSGEASAYPPGGAFYRTNTAGQSEPINDLFYVTLSPDPLDPLPSLERPAAPFREVLQSRIVLDYFSQNRYAEDERILRLIRLYGLDDVLLIYRNWQQFGYERRGPCLYPADPERGGNQDFRRMMQSITEGGWLVALREEYATVSADSPYYDEKAVAEWWDGQPRRSQRPGQFAIGADKMVDFARLEATKIQRNYRSTATFVDGHTAFNPEGWFRQVDADPKSRVRGEAAAIRCVEGLFDFLRDIHEGPVVGAAGEGIHRFDTFAAGMAEGIVRGPDGGSNADLVLDYELREVRPRLLGIGAGSYRQFCGHPTGEPVEASRIDWDAYRVTEIALGHLGYLANYRIKPGPRGIAFPGGTAANAVREYFLLRRLQELMVESPVREIRYEQNDEFLVLADALAAGLDLTQPRLFVEYDNGLALWINRSSTNWTVDSDGHLFQLPPSGFVARSEPGELLVYSANLHGSRVDFAGCPGYTFVDARGPGTRTIEGIACDGSVALIAGDVEGYPDVVLVGARQLTLHGEETDLEYRLSERGDLRLTHLSELELEITVLDTENGKPVHVTWPQFSEAWKGQTFQVDEWANGAYIASRLQVQQTRNGPQLSRAQPGVTYRISVPL